MSGPRVSIIIPCFNGADHVCAAIDSALAQTGVSFEVIVVDDGSTDASAMKIAAYGDRVRAEFRSNRGGCAARNHGVEIAEGEFIQFLDADDLLDDCKLVKQVHHAEVECSPGEISICLGRAEGDALYFDSQLKRELAPDRDVFDFLLHGILQTSAPLHRRANLLQVGGFDTALRSAQEWDLHLRLACEGFRFRQLREQLFTVRRQPNSVSSDSTRVVLTRLSIVQRALALLDGRGDLSRERKFSFGKLLSISATELELAGLADEAAGFRAAAARLDPDIAVLSWSPQWRPLVRWLGSSRTERLRRYLRRASRSSP